MRRPAIRSVSVLRCSVQAAWVAALLAGCAADERGLTFTLSAETSAGTSGNSNGDPSAGGDGPDAMAGAAGAELGETGGDGTTTGGKGSHPSGEAGASPLNGGSSNGGSTIGGSSSGASSSGDTSTGGTANGGTASGGTSTGVAGTAGSGGAPFVSPCGDLNNDRVDDCDETLVQNSRFNTDATGWEAEPMLAQLWTSTNATGGTASGSLSVANQNFVAAFGGSVTVGSRQCVKAWGGTTFDVGARAFIKSGQGSGRAGINLLFYGGDGCSGSFVAGSTIGTVTDVDVWRVIEGQVEAPAGARSMYVRLVSVKPFSQASLEALFDDVLVSERK